MTMRLYHIIFSLLACVALVSCGVPEESHGHEHDEAEALVYTNYTAQTELFVEFPPLQVGNASRFLAHFTYLDDFSPVKGGTVDVILRQQGAEKARFRVRQATRDGLFTPVVQPRTSGVYEVSVLLTNDKLSSEHHLGALEVFAADSHSHVDQPEIAGDITFLKEQQWAQEFATTVVETKALQSSVPAYAEVMAPANQRAQVAAAQAGYLFLEADIQAGQSVQQGQRLGTLVTRAESSQDLIALQLQLADHTARQQLAQTEVERLQKLVDSGAIPANRLAQAQADLALVSNQVEATEARIAQRQSTTRAGGIAIVSPVSGIVLANMGYDGMYVEANQSLFHIASASERWLQLHIPEQYSDAVNTIEGAWFSNDAEILKVGPHNGAKVVARTYEIDPTTRTFAVTLAVPAKLWSPMVGTRMSAFATLTEQRSRTAIPVSSVVRQEGKDVVFVHTSGETFERREVSLGIRDGAWVEVTQGLHSGERVVSTGAYEVRLAAMAGDDIGHGHAH